MPWSSTTRRCAFVVIYIRAVEDEEYPMPIEQFAPELENIISLSKPIQMLADGFGGPQGPAEGPVWWKEGGYLLFSDIHNKIGRASCRERGKKSEVGKALRKK